MKNIVDRFYFEVPSIGRKEEALDYLREHEKYGSAINGTGSMDRCLKGMSYEEWLEELERRKDREYLEKIGRCFSKTFFLIRESDNRIVGMINVRYNLSEKRLAEGSTHIGYGIRPSERSKGYNKINLYLGLLEEQKLGEKKLILDCTVDNVASNKTILALGGKLIKTELDSYDNTMTNFYVIDTDKSIENYSSLYKKFILPTKSHNKI
ncbi:MAG TPA: GNAT family N-acetyltransferase [Firmicutes bacterium]|nr:GNAT family N-acetyltransferase [Bacillota bacterium]